MTNDAQDITIEALGRRRSETLEVAPEWEAFSRGELSEDELRQRRLAAGDQLAAIEHAIDLYRPLSRDEHERLRQATQRALAQLGLARRRARVVIVATLLAAAAASAFVWTRPPPEPSEQLVALPVSGLELPAYDLEQHGGVEYVRGASEREAVVCAPETLLEWTLAPRRDVSVPLRAKVLAFPQQGPGRELALPLELSSTGTVHVETKGALLGLAPGHWTIVIAVARSSAEHDDHALLELLDPRTPERPETDWRVGTLQVEVIE